MKDFKLLRENNEMIAKLSPKHKLFKEFIIKDLDTDDVSEIKELLELNKESLESKGQVTLKSFQDLDEKIKFVVDHSEIVNDVLEDSDWFSKTPAQMNIKSVTQWLAEGLDKALLMVINTILNEI